MSDSAAALLIASGDDPERLAMTSRSCGWQRRTVLVAPGRQSEGEAGRHGHHSLGMLLSVYA